MRADRLKHVRPILISKIPVASRMGLAASGSNFSVAITEKLPVRALSYKAVFSIRGTKVASARLALGTVTYQSVCYIFAGVWGRGSGARYTERKFLYEARCHKQTFFNSKSWHRERGFHGEFVDYVLRPVFLENVFQLLKIKTNRLGFEDHRVAKNAIHDVHKNIIE